MRMNPFIISSVAALALAACQAVPVADDISTSVDKGASALSPAGLMIDVHEGAFADIQRFTTPGGASVWLVSEPGIPIIAVDMAWKGGDVQDPEGLEGLTDAMVYHMNEGAGDIDSLGFQTRMEELNMSFGCSGGAEWTSCSVNMLSENSGEVMDLVSLAFADPRFDEVPFERFRREAEVGLKTREASAGYLGWRAEADALYPDHPYARETSAESIAALTPEGAKAHMRKLMVKDRILVTVVGDVTPDEIAPMIDQVMAGLPDTSEIVETPEITLLPATSMQSPIVVALPQPQSNVKFIGPALRKDDPDFFPAYVLNYKFGGGGFDSRLMQSLRVEQGLTYGVYSGVSGGKIMQSWTAAGQTKNETAGAFIDGIKQEMEKIAATGLTEEELDAAKAYLIGSYPLGFDSNAKIASQLMSIRKDDLRDITYFDTRNDRFNAVTLEDVNRVAKEYLQPERFSVIVVGEPEGVSTSGDAE